MSLRARLILLALGLAFGAWGMIHRNHVEPLHFAVLMIPTVISALCPHRLFGWWAAIAVAGTIYVLHAGSAAAAESVSGVFGFVIVFGALLTAAPIFLVRAGHALWLLIADCSRSGEAGRTND